MDRRAPYSTVLQVFIFVNVVWFVNRNFISVQYSVYFLCMVE